MALPVLGGLTDGIKMEADHDTVRNCWVHNNTAMGVAMHHRNGGIIESNLIEFNGSHPQLDHGIYADGDGLIVKSNIVRHNAGYGMQLYPKASNFVVSSNLIYGHPRKAGIILACPKGGGKNRVINNTLAENNGGIDVWDGDGEVIANNILVSGSKAEVLAFKSGSKNMVVDYNLCLPASEPAWQHGVTGDPQFVNASRGAFWLKEGSPAIGAGGAEYAPATDFWDRPLPAGKVPDLGASNT